MRYSKVLVIPVSVILAVLPAAGQTSGRFFNPAIERRVDSLLAVMTLDEKLGQLNQLPGHWDTKQGRVTLTDEQRVLVEQGLVGSFLGGLGLETTREMQEAAARSRLRIPLIFGHDVIHGYRTVFPIPLAEASTFDPEAVEMAARIAAREATAGGVHWTFAPMVDIARDPRWGRIAEGSGEDTYLGSVLAAARVRGFQGRDFSDPSTLVACAKHFAAYGAAEGGRDYNIANIPERTLREVYLPPFKAAVDAGVGSLMSAFNEIDGIPATAHRGIMTDILRNEWGFKGFVVSDYTAVLELLRHGVASIPADAAVLSLNAGVDMEMVSEFYRKELPALIKKGEFPITVVDESVRRVLRLKFALGLFENPLRNYDPARFTRDILRKDHREFARQYAAKSTVLLKNEKSLLPLRKNTKAIAVIGPLADSRHEPLGPWLAEGKAHDVVTLLEGVRSAVSKETKVLYARGCDSTFIGTGGFAEAVRVAKQADVVILAVGERHEMSGEAASRTDIGLPGVQLDLVKQIHATGKPVVLVLMNGRPLTIPWEAEHIPAIVEGWFLGVETGHALADVLFGDVNPSGRLAVSFPRSTGQIPVYYNHKNTGRPPSEQKYTSKYLDSPNTPLYPFGFGLSYTAFEYSNLKIGGKTFRIGNNVDVSVEVRNTGNRAGDEVVQLYVQDVVAGVTRPVKELRGFRRIHLKPGESSTVRFTLNPGDLEFYGPEMKKIAEPGLFKVYAGGNSVDVLEADFELVR